MDRGGQRGMGGRIVQKYMEDPLLAHTGIRNRSVPSRDLGVPSNTGPTPDLSQNSGREVRRHQPLHYAVHLTDRNAVITSAPPPGMGWDDADADASADVANASAAGPVPADAATVVMQSAAPLRQLTHQPGPSSHVHSASQPISLGVGGVEPGSGVKFDIRLWVLLVGPAYAADRSLGNVKQPASCYVFEVRCRSHEILSLRLNWRLLMGLSLAFVSLVSIRSHDYLSVPIRTSIELSP